MTPVLTDLERVGGQCAARMRRPSRKFQRAVGPSREARPSTGGTSAVCIVLAVRPKTAAAHWGHETFKCH